MKKTFYIILIVITGIQALLAQTSLVYVANFGNNPGNLSMYYYAPDNLPANAPLVLVLHGCTQNAAQISGDTDWNKLADLYGFYVLYPEQKSINNTSNCFNWFLSAHQQRNSGEPASIAQMTAHLKTLYSIDEDKVFITGVSAGAGITAIMMATYPDLFSAAAIMAGCPYKSATNAAEAWSAMGGQVIKTPAEWANLVFGAYPSYPGAYPRLAIFHGLNDNTVVPANMTELVKQWTAVHGLSQTASQSIPNFAGNNLVEANIYNDASNQPIVVTYSIANMGHAVSINPGICPWNGGTSAVFASDKDFHSPWYAADFFNIIPQKTIEGPDTVLPFSDNLIFRVINTQGSSYNWDGPPDIFISSGQGTHEVNVSWANSSGEIYVQETNSDGCVFPELSHFVYVDFFNHIHIAQNNNTNDFIIGAKGKSLTISTLSSKTYEFRLVNANAQTVWTEKSSGAKTERYCCRHLPDGLYFLQISYNKNNKTNNKATFTKKIRLVGDM